MILANDDRPRTMHAAVERTERDSLPSEIIEVLQRQENRRHDRQERWRTRLAAAEASRTRSESTVATEALKMTILERGQGALEL